MNEAKHLESLKEKGVIVTVSKLIRRDT